jgi:hypothetical protein
MVISWARILRAAGVPAAFVLDPLLGVPTASAYEPGVSDR